MGSEDVGVHRKLLLDLDGGSGVIFPFYDADTHMLYLAGKVLNVSLSVS